MGAIKVRVAVRRAGIVGVVPTVEKPQPALLIESMRIGVGTSYLKAMAETLIHVNLQCVVVRNTDGPVEIRIGVVSQERRAQCHIACSKALHERGDIFGGDAGNVVSVRVNLLVGPSGKQGMLRGGDLSLIEWKRNHFMGSVVRDVAQAKYECIAGLPLDVERPILGVRQNISGIVTSEHQWSAAGEVVCRTVRGGVGNELGRVRNQI